MGGGDRSESRTAGWVLVVVALFALLASFVMRRPLGPTLLDGAHPYGLTFLELGSYSAMAALLCFRPPYNGAPLLPGTAVAGMLLATLNDVAADAHSYPLLAIGLAAFPVTGAVWMLMCKLDVAVQHRRPYWQEAWPGVVILIVGAGVVMRVALLDGPNFGFWLPPGVVPAEAPQSTE